MSTRVTSAERSERQPGRVSQANTVMHSPQCTRGKNAQRQARTQASAHGCTLAHKVNNRDTRTDTHAPRTGAPPALACYARAHQYAHPPTQHAYVRSQAPTGALAGVEVE